MMVVVLVMRVMMRIQCVKNQNLTLKYIFLNINRNVQNDLSKIKNAFDLQHITIIKSLSID